MTPPRVTLQPGALTDSDAEVLACSVVSRDGRAAVRDPDLLAALGLDPGVPESLRASADAGEVAEVPLVGHPGAQRLLLVGAGDGGPGAARRSGAALARRTAGAGRVASDTAAGLAPDAARAHVEGFLLAAYSFRAEGAQVVARTAPPGAWDVHGAPAPGRSRRGASTADPAVEAAVRTAAAVHRARDLANTPSNLKDPAWLAAQAVAAGRAAGLDVTVRDERALAAEGFGGIVAVGAGSARPPRLIELRYRPTGTARRAPHVVLVGKGITFDTGGLSLKPREAMVPMKTDMAGGAAVIAVLAACRDAGVRVPVTGLVAAAENMPGAGALRPGDVLRHYGGRTVEVFNTDAEGRLVLADALAYADAQLDPTLVVDVATLTGAATLGLGRRHGALFSADEDLAAGLIAAGQASGERLWRMPLVEDYRPALDSAVADLANISRDPTVSGGSVVAALFLREFVGSRRWAHLDIAGPARAERDEHEVTKGATGFGTRLLLRWLEGLA